MLLASGYFGATGHTPVALQAVGAVGPGSMLTLQTAAGPMQLTVDSEMNQGAFPHLATQICPALSCMASFS